MKLIYLSSAFFTEYKDCTEILQKSNRPYCCLQVLIKGVPYAIPFRHHIAHKHAFRTVGDCGLDYTKAVVISKREYIATEVPYIDQAEFNAIKGKEQQIATGMKNFIKVFKKALQYSSSPHYANIIKYSSLQYFIKYL